MGGVGVRVVLFCLAASALLAGQPAAAQPTTSCESTETFKIDNDVQQVAEAYSLDAVDAARENFGVTLDWSDASIERVEGVLAQLYAQRDSAPSDDVVWTFAKMFGSYIGEVYRKNHGATWGTVTLQGQTFPGIQASTTCQLFWPWGKAHNRITQGEEENVLHYYRVLLAPQD